MKNLSKISRKFILLGAMLFTLGFISLTGDLSAPVGAAPCCSECESLLNACDQLSPGPDQDACYQQANRCFRRCSFSC